MRRALSARFPFARFRLASVPGGQRPVDPRDGWVTYEDGAGNWGYVVDESGARISYDSAPESGT